MSWFVPEMSTEPRYCNTCARVACIFERPGRQVRALEDEILVKLSNADSNITEDRALIESLEGAKRLAGEISQKVVVGAVTQREIEVASEKYRPVACRGALLAFLMSDLGRAHSYYA